MIVCEPAESVVDSVATPLLSGSWPRTVLFSSNVTIPVAVPPGLATVAMIVTVPPEPTLAVTLVDVAKR